MPLSPPETAALQTILSALSSSPQAWIFLEVPDRKLYPDYYMFIKEPQSLHQIQKSLQKGVYPAAQLVAYDLFLVWANARQYNQEGSDIYNNSLALEAQMKSLWKQHHPPLPKFKHLVMKPDNWSDPSSKHSSGEHKKKKHKAEHSPPPLPQAAPQQYYQPQPSTSHTPAPTRIVLGGGSAALGTPQTPSHASPAMPKLKLSLGGGGTPAAATPPPQQQQYSTPGPAPLKLKFGGQSVALSQQGTPAHSPPPPQPTAHSTPNTINPAQLLSRPQHPAPPTIPRFSVPPRPQQPQIPRVSVPPRPQPPAMPAGSRAPHVGNLFGRPPLPTMTRPPPTQGDYKPVMTPVHHPAAAAPPQPPAPTPVPAVAPSPAPSTPATPAGTPGVINLAASAASEPKVPKERKAERKARVKAERKAAKEAEAAVARAAKAAGLPPPSKATPGPEGGKREGALDPDSGWMPAVAGGPDAAKGKFLEILGRLQSLKDESGRQLAAPLLALPSREQRPDYYNLVPNPIAIETIQAKVVQGLYPNADAFDRDLHSLFQVAKLFINKDSPGPLYTDLLVLQRLYYALTKRQAVPPPNPAAPVDRGTVENRVFLSGANFKGQQLRVGDFLHLMNPSDLSQPTIAQVFKLFSHPSSPRRSMTVCLYARPEHTSHPPERTFLPTEVFKTGTFEDHDVEETIERVSVQFVEKWVLGRPKWFKPGMSSYVCDSRYKHDERVFKRIKNWTSCLPDEVRAVEDELELLPEPQRIAPASIVRLASPFKIDPSTGLNAVQKREQERGPRPNYFFHDNGEPAGSKDEIERAKSRYAVEQQQQQVRMREEALKLARERAQATAAAAASASPAPANGAPAANGANGANGAPAPRAGGWPASRFVSTAREAPAKDGVLTPAETILAKESFKALPEGIAQKFKRDGEEDVLWFTTPSRLESSREKEESAPLGHSLEYLYWRAMQLREGDKMELVEV